MRTEGLREMVRLCLKCRVGMNAREGEGDARTAIAGD